MNDNPKISIVLTFLNAEKFIVETIESVLGQSYGEWELLLVDDGSTDHSTQIALGYARKYPRQMRYLEHPAHENRGMSAARNLGIRAARGQYIAFLDADDVWQEEKLAEQERLLREQPEVGMVYGATQYWYSWSGLPEDRQRDLLIEHGIQPNRVVEPPALLIHFLLGDTAIPCPSDILIRRSALEDCGGCEESFRYIFTDQALYAKLCLRTPVYVSSQCWFRYRRHPESSVSLVKKKGELRKARLMYLTWVESYLAAAGLKGSEVWKAAKLAQWRCRHPNLSRLIHHLRYLQLVTKERLISLARRSLPQPLYHSVRVRWQALTGSGHKGTSINPDGG